MYYCVFLCVVPHASIPPSADLHLFACSAPVHVWLPVVSQYTCGDDGPVETKLLLGYGSRRSGTLHREPDKCQYTGSRISVNKTLNSLSLGPHVDIALPHQSGTVLFAANLALGVIRNPDKVCLKE